MEALIGRAKASFFMTPGSSVADAAFLSASKGAGELSGSAGFDPLTALALSGERPADKSALFADYIDAAFRLREGSPGFVPSSRAARLGNRAGGSATEELGFTLAAGVAYWRALSAAAMFACGCRALHRIFALGLVRHFHHDRDVQGHAPALGAGACGGGRRPEPGLAPPCQDAASRPSPPTTLM